MNTQKRIPVTIVTGFLGSGKTTLLNRILSEAHGKRIAIIENEFGEVSIDDALLADTNLPVFKMSNGCLCCTVNGDLVRTLEELADRSDEFDYVIIETTGIANPAPIVQMFMVNEDISGAFELDAVVTTIDARHIGQHIDSRECQEQIAFADVMLVNKLNLVSVEEADALLHTLKHLNALATVHLTERSNVTLGAILDQRLFSGEASDAHEHDCGCGHDHEHGHDHDHNHNHDHEHEHHGHLHAHHHDEQVESVGVQVSGTLDRERFNKWFGALIQEHGDNLYRCKGILNVGGDNKVVVQTVHRIVEVTTGSAWADGTRQNQIVFIGRDLNRAILAAEFKNCMVT